MTVDDPRRQLRICRPSCAMTDTQDCYPARRDTIANDVGIWADQLTHRGTRHLASAIGESGQAVTQTLEAGRNFTCRTWVELPNVGTYLAEIGQCRSGPDNLDQRCLGTGQGNSSAVPHDSNHFATSA